jgi:uncharacterized protein YdeI (YjbR/CyaY-like superfamily)
VTQGVESTHSDGKPMVQVEHVDEWTHWLADHHAECDGVWLVTWKKAAAHPSVAYADTVEAALTVGWVDSRPNTLDDERSMRWFTPRDPSSPWSRINKATIGRLERYGRLTPAGRALVDAAKANGAWTVYDDIEDLVIPDGLSKTLDSDRLACENFDRFTDSAKKNILWWIKSAKHPAPRATRIRTTAELAADNLMANHPEGRDRGPAKRNDRATLRPHRTDATRVLVEYRTHSRTGDRRQPCRSRAPADADALRTICSGSCWGPPTQLDPRRPLMDTARFSHAALAAAVSFND